MSERHINADTHKLISIRKSPFIKIYEEMYLISDVSFLLEKAYSQLINDFWFDYIKHLQSKSGKDRYPISQYRSMIGYFFESYVAQILKASFQHYHQAKLLVFDELKLTVKKAPIELADFYLRADHTLLVGQVKSASIYDNQKYGGDITALYKGSREDFFINFGVDQLIQSILNLQQYGQQLDPTFQASEAYTVYSVILVNDKALCNALMANVFNERFQELLVTIPTPLFTVKPLSLIHINEDAVRRWNNRLNQARQDPRTLDWIAQVVTVNQQVVGHAGFHGPPNQAGMVEVAYSVVPAQRGKGYAKSMLRDLLRRARSEEDVRVIRATIRPDNTASLATIRPFKFVHKGE